MKQFWALVVRNIKLFFKDRGLFVTSLITPGILLVLYTTFLGDVFRDTFTAEQQGGFVLNLSEKVVDALVGGQLVSSILATCCVTVAFCANFLIVQDRANGSIYDLTITPTSMATISMAYYLAAFLSTVLTSFCATGLCLGYLGIVGFYMSASDVLWLLLDVALLSLFGTALSSFINNFLSSLGQITAVETIVSAGYGFICGAYMPIHSFDESLQNVLKYFPTTYATSLVRNHSLAGAYRLMEEEDVHADVIAEIKKVLDCAFEVGDAVVEIPTMYLITAATILLLVAGYVLVSFLRRKKA